MSLPTAYVVREEVIFSLCLSVHRGGIPHPVPGEGGGYPIQLAGGGYPVQLAGGGYPIQLQARGGTPSSWPGGYPIQLAGGGYPIQVAGGVPRPAGQGGVLRPAGWGGTPSSWPRGGGPHPRSRQGYPPRLGYPPGWGTPPPVLATAAVGMPLAFTQEDFLVWLTFPEKLGEIEWNGIPLDSPIQQPNESTSTFSVL